MATSSTRLTSRTSLLVVVGIAKPAADRDSMLRVENVRSRRVVDDDGLLQITADHAKILDVVALMVVAAFPEKSMVHDIVNVQLVQ
ncbi:hypothetical protein KC316_g11 [Hortaea werneckii]|nr:hypothetical protein KC316_g11 [Hortaea werneckii]